LSSCVHSTSLASPSSLHGNGNTLNGKGKNGKGGTAHSKAVPDLFLGVRQGPGRKGEGGTAYGREYRGSDPGRIAPVLGHEYRKSEGEGTARHTVQTVKTVI